MFVWSGLLAGRWSQWSRVNLSTAIAIACKQRPPVRVGLDLPGVGLCRVGCGACWCLRFVSIRPSARIRGARQLERAIGPTHQQPGQAGVAQAIDQRLTSLCRPLARARSHRRRCLVRSPVVVRSRPREVDRPRVRSTPPAATCPDRMEDTQRRRQPHLPLTSRIQLDLSRATSLLRSCRC